MADSFPRQQARTRDFSLGAPRSFQIAPDGATVTFLRSAGGTDPVTSLWALDVGDGTERLIADPARLGSFGGTDDEREKARRERVRERATGITAYATDAAATVAAFAVAGRVYLARLDGPTPDSTGITELPVATPAADPRPDPAGTRVAYACDGDLRVIDVAGRHRPGGGRPGRRAGRLVRPGRVHRRRGDGPDPRLLVGAGRLGPAGRPGG